MILDDLRAVCEELNKAKIGYVVVGGASIERRFPIGTGDVDVAVALKDYPAVLRMLRRHPRVRNVEDVGTMAGCEFLIGTRWVDVEFINPKLFSGAREPDDFIGYVRRHRSERTDLAVFAAPEVVWYMRLAVPDWPVYVQKIVRDVRAGVPATLLNKVADIAERFGMEETMQPRIRDAEEMAGLATAGRASASNPSRGRDPFSDPSLAFDLRITDARTVDRLPYGHRGRERSQAADARQAKEKRKPS